MSQLTAKTRAQLRSAAFAYVDSKGRRRLPIHDEAHVRNALARFNQTKFENDAARERARKRLLTAAKKYGIVPIGFIAGQLATERLEGESKGARRGGARSAERSGHLPSDRYRGFYRSTPPSGGQVRQPPRWRASPSPPRCATVGGQGSRHSRGRAIRCLQAPVRCTRCCAGDPAEGRLTVLAGRRQSAAQDRHPYRSSHTGRRRLRGAAGAHCGPHLLCRSRWSNPPLE